MGIADKWRQGKKILLLLQVFKYKNASIKSLYLKGKTNEN